MLHNVTKSDPMVLAGVVLLLGIFTSLMISDSVAQTSYPLKAQPENTFVTDGSDVFILSPNLMSNNADTLLQKRSAEVKEN